MRSSSGAIKTGGIGNMFRFHAPALRSPLVAKDPATRLVEQFSKFVALDVADVAAIAALTQARRIFGSHETLVHEDSKAERIYLIVEGVGYRYRFLADGRRQIFGYLLPGDLCDTQFVLLDRCDHNVGLLCDSEVAVISPRDLMTAMVNHPKIERALLMLAVVEGAMMREWLLNIGQRNAFQKIAHFFCEMATRLEAAGLMDGNGCYPFPATQTEIADTLGLTVVHVNRTLQRLRGEGILYWSRRQFQIVNRSALETVAGFDSAYLHLEETQVEPKLCAYGS